MTRTAGSDLEWMALQIDTLYASDARGRLLRPNEPGDSPAPRFFLGRTRHGNLWRFRADLSDRAVRHLSRLAGREPLLAAAPRDEPPPPERMQPFRDVLEGEGEPVRDEYRGPAFRFANTLSDASTSPPAPVLLKLEHVAGMAAHFAWLPEELGGRQPAYGIVDGDDLVSLCCCARRTTVAAEASLETAPPARGRGHAARVVAAWATALRASGLEPLYSTTWKNRVSRAVALRLGLVVYGEDLHFT